MTPKIARFLAEQQPATPCLVLDVDRVDANFRALEHALPLARIYYAVKANPGAPILQRLVRLGSSFDAASWEEIQACLDAGARPDAISFGNTIKKLAAIRRAYEAGVSLYAFGTQSGHSARFRSPPTCQRTTSASDFGSTCVNPRTTSATCTPVLSM